MQPWMEQLEAILKEEEARQEAKKIREQQKQDEEYREVLSMWKEYYTSFWEALFPDDQTEIVFLVGHLALAGGCDTFEYPCIQLGNEGAYRIAIHRNEGFWQGKNNYRVPSVTSIWQLMTIDDGENVAHFKWLYRDRAQTLLNLAQAWDKLTKLATE